MIVETKSRKAVVNIPLFAVPSQLQNNEIFNKKNNLEFRNLNSRHRRWEPSKRSKAFVKVQCGSAVLNSDSAVLILIPEF